MSRMWDHYYFVRIPTSWLIHDVPAELHTQRAHDVNATPVRSRYVMTFMQCHIDDGLNVMRLMQRHINVMPHVDSTLPWRRVPAGYWLICYIYCLSCSLNANIYIPMFEIRVTNAILYIVLPVQPFVKRAEKFSLSMISNIVKCISVTSQSTIFQSCWTISRTKGARDKNKY